MTSQSIGQMGPWILSKSERIEAMTRLLSESLDPSFLEIVDDSHQHIGHVGARDGRGHFRLRISSGKFDGLGRMASHRLVYQALGDMMSTDIHALNIEVISSNEQ